jgi:glycosyltransferase involved in cell wall biosynthesis
VTLPADDVRPLRVLECLTYYLPHRTGLTLHVQRLAEGLAARGHQVTVVSARFRRQLPRDEHIAGVRVVRLWAPLRISRGMIMPAYPLALWRLIKAHDVVHAHTPMLELLLVARLATLAGRPLVVTHHGDLVLPTGAANDLIARIMLALHHAGAASAASIVTYSRDYAEHSRYLAPHLSKVAAILPPVAIPVPEPERVEALRTRLGIGGGPILGYAGRFVEEKRPDLLLQALPRVRRSFPQAVAVFAGQHELPYERYLERCRPLLAAAGDTVRFAGLLEDPRELAAFYALCDVLVLPSASECFGLVQPEAMLCGTPVVATDIPGARVPVRETGMGLLVAPGAPDALAEAIRTVLSDPQAARRERRAIEARFSLDATLAAYERVLADAWGARRR